MPPVTHTILRYGGGKQRDTTVHFTQVKGTGQEREYIVGPDIHTRADVTCYNYNIMNTFVYSALIG